MRCTALKIWFPLLASAALVGVSPMCSEDNALIDTTEGITDPYCVDTPDWFEGLEVTAEYSEDDPGKIVVGIEPANDIVDMNGRTDIDGAGVDTIALEDMHSLWMVLVPNEDVDTVVIRGNVDCTTLTRKYVLVLHLSPSDKSVTYELSYVDETEQDAGDGNDAGV